LGGQSGHGTGGILRDNCFSANCWSLLVTEAPVSRCGQATRCYRSLHCVERQDLSFPPGLRVQMDSLVRGPKGTTAL
jgi:hypothetical protein